MYTGWLSLDLGKIEQAEQAIARMPAAVFRLLQDTLAQAPNGDAFLYYWYGLALEQRALPAQALDAYMVALKRHDWAAGYRWRIGFRAAGAAFSLQRLALVKQLLSQIVLTEFPVYEAALRLLRACEQPAPETQQTAPQSAAPQSAAPQSAAPNPATPATVIADKQVDKQPLVTAIVSTYNSARFLEGCLEDLEAQTIAERLEIIVVNSGSQQSEGRIVRAYQRRYKNIVYMHTQERETVYAAWNRAIQAANGKYLTNANADDRHHPRAFEIMSSILEGKPEIDVIYADCAVTSKENTALQRGPLSGRFRWPEFDRRLLFQVCMVGPQPMWRRSLHDKFGLFDAEMKSAGDYEFWLRISRQARFFHLPQVLGLYYESPTSIEHRAPEQSLYEAEAARQRYWLAGDGLRPQPGGMFLERFEPVPGLVYPLVSVILPTYNRPEELEKALRSITSQTYPNLEVIVVNDGGQDVCAIVKGFEGRLPVRYLAHETNRGAGAARNTAMRLAQGKYFAFLDDDDCYFPVHLMALVNELEQRPRLAAAYSDALQISLVQGSGGKPARNRVSGQEVVFSVDFSQDELLARNYIPNLCLLARADAVRKVGHFDESLPALEDWEWLIRLSQAGSFSHLPLVTAQYVVRENVASRNILSLRQVRSLYQSIYMKHRSMGSQAARSLQRQVYQLKIGSDLQADLPELFAAAPAAPALHAPGPAEPPSAGASRAAALLERLLEAEDLLQALQANQDQFDADLLSLVQSNAAAARADGDVDLADGLADLAEYIVAVIAVQGVEVL
jgi:glycosyltransferase involved in cell wall biosynthesis